MGLFTNLRINRLNLLNDSERISRRTAGAASGCCVPTPFRSHKNSRVRREPASPPDVGTVRAHCMELLELEFSREIHPVDVIEQVASNNDWSFERAGDDEISISCLLYTSPSPRDS